MPNHADTPRSVAILGLGYVGLPLAAAFAHAGVRTLGYDIDPAKIDALRAGRSYLAHLGPDFASRLLATGTFEPTADADRLSEPDALLICVPTPLGPHREPDLSFVERTADTIATVLRPGQLVVLESSTYPGTTRGVLLPRLERTGLAAGEHFFCAYSPERENPGGTLPTAKIPKLVGGLDPASTTRAAALYRLAFDSVIETPTAEVAEAAKLLENIYRSVNIALVNELKVILDALGIDIRAVIDAAATKPFGFQRFDPGPGLGGHCIPIDPYYLAWQARAAGHTARFIELAGEINHAMPRYVADRLAGALNDRGLPLRDASVLVLGLAYKKDIDDVRESPAIEIIDLLRQRGAIVDYHDPLVPRTHRMRRHDLEMESIPLTPDALRLADAVVIVTDHSAVDYQLVADHARLIIDTRNATRAVTGPRDHIVHA